MDVPELLLLVVVVSEYDEELTDAATLVGVLGTALINEQSNLSLSQSPQPFSPRLPSQRTLRNRHCLHVSFGGWPDALKVETNCSILSILNLGARGTKESGFPGRGAKAVDYCDKSRDDHQQQGESIAGMTLRGCMSNAEINGCGKLPDGRIQPGRLRVCEPPKVYSIYLSLSITTVQKRKEGTRQRGT